MRPACVPALCLTYACRPCCAVPALLQETGYPEERFFIHCDGALFGMMVSPCRGGVQQALLQALLPGTQAGRPVVLGQQTEWQGWRLWAWLPHTASSVCISVAPCPPCLPADPLCEARPHGDLQEANRLHLGQRPQVCGVARPLRRRHDPPQVSQQPWQQPAAPQPACSSSCPATRLCCHMSLVSPDRALLPHPLPTSAPLSALLTPKTTTTACRHIKGVSSDVEYLNSRDATIMGSRNGHAPIYMWYTFTRKGYEGLRKDVEKCLRNAHLLKVGGRVGRGTVLGSGQSGAAGAGGGLGWGGGLRSALRPLYCVQRTTASPAQGSLCSLPPPPPHPPPPPALPCPALPCPAVDAGEGGREDHAERAVQYRCL